MKRIIFIMCVVAVMAGTVWAAGAYDLKEMTPPVKAALDARKARYAELKAFKKQGQIGETNRGYVKALGTAAGVKQVADAENADRKVIYQAIVDQNGLQASGLATVEEVFAQVQRNKAEPGEKIQKEDGSWTVK